MLAEQLGDLQAAEQHYEANLALAARPEAAEAQALGRAAAFTNVMKVRCCTVTNVGAHMPQCVMHCFMQHQLHAACIHWTKPSKPCRNEHHHSSTKGRLPQY